MRSTDSPCARIADTKPWVLKTAGMSFTPGSITTRHLAPPPGSGEYSAVIGFTLAQDGNIDRQPVSRGRRSAALITLDDHHSPARPPPHFWGSGGASSAEMR